MLGGTDGECPPPYSAFEDLVTFEGDAYEHPSSIGLTLVLRTQRLLPCVYPASHLPLSDRVIELRDNRGMTFPAIAALLQGEGYLGAAGAAMTDAGVYSVYTKRKAHDGRRSAPVRAWIRKIFVFSS